jgi:hypothetical protein
MRESSDAHRDGWDVDSRFDGVAVTSFRGNDGKRRSDD